MTGLGAARPSRAALVLALLAAAFFLIARTTGSGWVTVLLCGVAAALVGGAVWPAPAVMRAQVAVEAPRDATVGQPLTVRVALGRGGWVQVRLRQPPGPWMRADAPAAGEVMVTPEQRGVFGHADVEVRSGAPLGLFWWRRVVPAPLAAPLEVGPRPLDVCVDDAVAPGAAGPVSLRGRAGHDSVRSVRPYAPGDLMALVHWPATARWGEVMVKELEEPELARLAVSVDLRGGPAEAEVTASRAAGLAIAALTRGVPVWLLTTERGGPIVSEVASPVEVGRRLARAVPGPPPDGPVPRGAVVVRMAA
jgi:uncharacterized protein (DUF58 family)